jgi:hypothetical protein
MYRFVLVAGLAAAACNQTDNDRPQTLAYITEAILQPYCSQNVCHSSYAKTQGYAFDTVDAAQKSLSIPGLVNPGEPDTSLLYTVLIRSVERMPYDAPMPDKDIELIKEWITNGADGLDLSSSVAGAGQ